MPLGNARKEAKKQDSLRGLSGIGQDESRVSTKDSPEGSQELRNTDGGCTTRTL